MPPISVVELIGYIASILVAVSLTMKSILKLRIINLAGAAVFTVYGLAIRAYPVAAVNLFIMIINLYYLSEIYRSKEYFTLLQVRPDSAYLQTFINFYESEIKKFIPDYQYGSCCEDIAYFVLRNMVPAGLFLGEIQSAGVMLVKLDFVIPGYRDFKVGRFVFDKNASHFQNKGIQRIVTDPGSQKHASYLLRMGFSPDPNNPGLMVLEI
jgi:hypothetical protein